MAPHSRSIFVGAALAAWLVSACFSGRSVAASSAADDLACPKENVKILTIGRGAYRAIGCGRTATYECAQAILQVVPITVGCVQSSLPKNVGPTRH